MTEAYSAYSSKPRLIEPNIKYFLHHTLKQCHVIKNKYVNTVFNISLTILFLGILGGLLFYKYKGKLTPIEKQVKERKKKEYIFTQLNKIKVTENTKNNNLITNIPLW